MISSYPAARIVVQGKVNFANLTPNSETILSSCLKKDGKWTRNNWELVTVLPNTRLMRICQLT